MAKLEGVKVMDMVNGEITKIAYDGAEYAKVGDGFENANVGDIFTTPMKHTGMTPNTYYELIRTNSSEVRFYNDNDYYDGFNRTYSHAKVFRKISDGKPTIEALVDDLEKRVEAIEKTEETTKFKVGDYIVGKNLAPYRITNEDMTLGIVEKAPPLPGNDICVKVLAHKTYPSEIGETFSVESKYFRKATAEEIEEYERGQKTKPNVGEYIKFTRYGEYNYWGITLNKPYKVIGELTFLDDDGDERSQPLECTDCYEIISEDEVKLAKIGRKAGEFKKGDIVRITRDCNGHPKGTIGVLVDGSIFAFPREFGVLANGKIYDHTDGFELVAPVESVLTQK